MKKIHKNTTISSNNKVEKIPQNEGFLAILPNLLRLFPNFDISKIIQNFFSQNQEKEPEKSIKTQQIATQKYDESAKTAALFLEKHQNLLKEIKQKNRP